MKKIVLVHGIIAGLIVGLWIVVIVSVKSPGGLENGMFYGYASMLLAFSMIFVAVKKYRDQQSGGVISFGKAFRIGLYITLIASTIYVLAWLFSFYNFIPDYLEKYTAMEIEKMRLAHASQAAIDAEAAKMKSFGEMYKNPFFNAMMTYAEILPVGLLVSLICAFILKRKPTSQAVGAA